MLDALVSNGSLVSQLAQLPQDVAPTALVSSAELAVSGPGYSWSSGRLQTRVLGQESLQR